MNPPSIKIGPYGLNEPVGTYDTARKVSLLARMFGLHKSLPGVTPYDGGKIDLLETKWTVSLGVYQGRIVRISARWVCDNRTAMEAKVYELVTLCEQQFERALAECERKDVRTWETPLGVVTVNVGELSMDGRPRFFTVTLEAISQPFVG